LFFCRGGVIPRLVSLRIVGLRAPISNRVKVIGAIVRAQGPRNSPARQISLRNFPDKLKIDLSRKQTYTCTAHHTQNPYPSYRDPTETTMHNPVENPHPSCNQPSTDIQEPHNNDVLCGRGVTTNRWIGNEQFRSLVGLNKVRHRAPLQFPIPSSASTALVHRAFSIGNVVAEVIRCSLLKI
jgi:hypothetical protein